METHSPRSDWVRASEQRAADALRRLMAEGTTEGTTNTPFLILSAGQYYVQFAKFSEHELLCEAVSNAFLPDDLWVSPDAERRLLSFGFEAPQGPRDNYARPLDLNDVQTDIRDLAAMVVIVMREVYNVGEDRDLGVEINLTG